MKERHEIDDMRKNITKPFLNSNLYILCLDVYLHLLIVSHLKIEKNDRY